MVGWNWLETYGFAAACSASVALALGAGVVDYLRFYQQRSTVIAAAWTGAREGAATLSEDARPSAAREAALRYVESELDVSAQVSASVWSDGTERYITVEVSVPYDDLMPLLPKPREVSAASTWRVRDGLTLRF